MAINADESFLSTSSFNSANCKRSWRRRCCPPSWGRGSHDRLGQLRHPRRPAPVPGPAAVDAVARARRVQGRSRGARDRAERSDDGLLGVRPARGVQRLGRHRLSRRRRRDDALGLKSVRGGMARPPGRDARPTTTATCWCGRPTSEFGLPVTGLRVSWAATRARAAGRVVLRALATADHLKRAACGTAVRSRHARRGARARPHAAPAPAAPGPFADRRRVGVGGAAVQARCRRRRGAGARLQPRRGRPRPRRRRPARRVT